MKKFISLFVATAMLLLALCVPVSAEEANYEVRIVGDYIEGLGMVTGQAAANEYQYTLSRYLTFAKEYQCDIYLWLWESLDSASCEYSSFEEAKTAMLEDFGGENSLCILYIADENEGFVSMGSGIVADYDTSKLEEILRTPDSEGKYEDPYYKMAAVFNELSESADKISGKQTGYIYCSSRWDEEAIQEAIAPLHAVFDGYISVDFMGVWAGGEGSALRQSAKLDYDEAYAKWEQKMEYYYKDAIFLTYYADTGAAFIDIGENCGIELSDKALKTIEESFKAISAENDYSGFANGVNALAEAITASEQSGNHPLMLAAVAAVVVLAIGTIYIIKKKK